MDILSRPVLRADHRIAYGSDPSQFGDLWLPESNSNAPCPVVAFFHGGWWKSEYDLNHAGYLCAALKSEGIAVWSIEYRRRGVTGGAWPATFQDAAAGFDFVSTLINSYSLDPSCVLTMGHSAGGLLAFWIAGRHHILPHSELFRPQCKLAVRGAISLAGAVDLRLTINLAGTSLFAHDRMEVLGLMGGSPQEYPERYRAGNPGDLLPLAVPQRLLQGPMTIRFPLNCLYVGSKWPGVKARPHQ
jgi:pimeloyl-ACP methyl ester carboxylesterase